VWHRGSSATSGFRLGRRREVDHGVQGSSSLPSARTPTASTASILPRSTDLPSAPRRCEGGALRYAPTDVTALTNEDGDIDLSRPVNHDRDVVDGGDADANAQIKSPTSAVLPDHGAEQPTHVEARAVLAAGPLLGPRPALASPTPQRRLSQMQADERRRWKS
jgi:hypothetical protein